MAKPTKKQANSDLINSLQFIAKVQKDKSDSPIQMHCQIANHQIVAFDGIVAAGCKTDTDLEACPHTYNLLSALNKCGDQLSITQLENSRLAIKSGRFSAMVPCYTQPLSSIAPDTSCASITDDLRFALGQVSHLADEGASRVICSTILLQANSVVATNAHVILEYWHGINLPRCILPKKFVSTLCSIDKKMISFGFSQANLNGKMVPNSCTFYFEDESWIKTQLYAEDWPDLSKVLDVPIPEPITMPEAFFEALKQIEDFSEGKKEEDRLVWITPENIRSHKDPAEGAVYEFKGMPESCFKIKQLKQVEKACKTFSYSLDKMYVFGDKIRGVVMGVRG